MLFSYTDYLNLFTGPETTESSSKRSCEVCCFYQIFYSRQATAILHLHTIQVQGMAHKGWGSLAKHYSEVVSLRCRLSNICAKDVQYKKQKNIYCTVSLYIAAADQFLIVFYLRVFIH